MLYLSEILYAIQYLSDIIYAIPFDIIYALYLSDISGYVSAGVSHLLSLTAAQSLGLLQPPAVKDGEESIERSANIRSVFGSFLLVIFHPVF